MAGLAAYVRALERSEVYAPYLKEMTLSVFRKHPSNRVARCVHTPPLALPCACVCVPARG